MKSISPADLEQFFELTHDLLCIVNDDGFLIQVNPAVSALLGYTQDELMDVPIATFIHPDDRKMTAQHREQLLLGKPLLHFENRYVTKSGDVAWLSWTAVYSPNFKQVYAIARDMTHNKRMEETRNSLFTTISAFNQDLKQLSFTTAHDLRSPVSSLLAALQLIDLSKIEDEETLGFLSILHSAADNLKASLSVYVEQLTNKEKLSVVVETCDLETTFSAVKNSIRTLLSSSGVEVSVDVSRAPTIRFNQTYLESVFLNLITNSIKYRKPDAVPMLTLVSYPTDLGVVVEYSDNGLGFDMIATRGKLFGFRETFHNNNDSKGIGMYLIHTHITGLGGRIELRSEPNQGSTFLMTFRN